jgi:hypothetical protein
MSRQDFGPCNPFQDLAFGLARLGVIFTDFQMTNSYSIERKEVSRCLDLVKYSIKSRLFADRLKCLQTARQVKSWM